ncbi:MAG: ATP synthase subunit I [Coxiellaceae bacterium]|jgi:F0F1-type ATP synthase assembly protein I|nr:ATP synthase subunit I [Coxiellaceae bacterium]
MWVLGQLIFLGIVTLVFIFISGWSSAQSVLLGGSAWIIPHWYFVWKVGRIKTIFNVRRMLKSFLFNELMKLILSFSIIILVLLTLSIDMIGFIVGYFAMVLLSSLSFFMWNKT